MSITEKAAYLKGLADGLELDNTTKEGKLIAALLDMVGALADEVAELQSDVQDLNEYCEELDEDLGEVEEYLCEEDDCDCCEDCDCDGDCDDCDCEGDCDECDCGCDCDCEAYEIECPACGDTICFDESVDPADLKRLSPKLARLLLMSLLSLKLSMHLISKHFRMRMPQMIRQSLTSMRNTLRK